KIYLVSDYNSDYTILYILRKDGSNFLLILTYIGGIAAATGMVIVASVSLTNMFINNIVINLFIKYFVKKSIGKFIVLLKRITIILIIMFGYFFYHFIGEKINLVDIGLTSFSAISQLGPAMILGLFVKRIPKGAVFYGILAGLLVWFYTLIIPYLANAGVISATILKDGLFNLSILKPTALFGLEGLEPWSHTLFWSMFFNLFFIVLFTLVKDQNEEEKETAALCVDSLGLHFLIGRYDKTSRMSLKDVENILTNFFGYEFAKKMINKFLEDIGKSKNELDSSDINMMVQKAKDVLSQAVGPSASEIIINSYIDMTSKGERNVLNIFKDLVTLGVGESRDTLIHRITEMNLLLEISKQFATTSDLIQKLKRTLDMIRENLRFSLIVLRRKRGDVLETIVYSGDIKSFRMISNIRKIDEKNTYIGRAVVNKTPFYINDIDTATDSVYIGELKSKGIKSFCHIPLIIDNEIEGVVSFFSKNYKNM
ncbi:MAG: serine/threonine protein phosphatase, partial [Deferribacterales bacterium]